ncbi:hypothetical protein [Hyphomonas jannaschiana]|uniref:hypothetical protein n=1 Tax=Hyphomonas jannaschiana TaxID=86 RepID=UPI0035C786DD
MSIKEFLWSDKVPIWWSLATSLVSAALGALFVLCVVPHFNRGFENEKIRTSFLLGKLNQLDAQSTNIALIMNEFVTQCSVDANSDASDLASELKQERFKLSLLAIEVSAMLPSDVDREKVKSMSSAASQLTIPRQCPKLDDLSEYIDQTGELKLKVLQVSQALARSADL